LKPPPVEWPGAVQAAALQGGVGSGAKAPWKLEPVALGRLPEAPLVSVLMSNYNYERYLGAAVESVLGQTYRQFELIICDDGSTDGSWEVIRSYAERSSQVRLVRKSNGGQASGFTAAWRQARGSIICFLDADDLYHPERLARVVEAFRSNGGAGLVIHRVARITATGESRGVLPFLGLLPSGWCGPAMLRNGGILGNLPVGCVCCLRREVADRIFPLPVNPVTRNFGDTPIIRLAPLISPVVSLPDVLYSYRLHGGNQGNSSQLNPERLARELHVYQEMWKLQREYLARIDPLLATCLADLNVNPHVVTVKYIKARLERNRAATKMYKDLMRPAQWREEPVLRRWFWKAAPYMPDPVFRPAIGLLFSPNRVKQLLGPLARVFRTKPYQYA
jgi:glycosyltransferase involved in cell wall biosynthesis